MGLRGDKRSKFPAFSTAQESFEHPSQNSLRGSVASSSTGGHKLRDGRFGCLQAVAPGPAPGHQTIRPGRYNNLDHRSVEVDTVDFKGVSVLGVELTTQCPLVAWLSAAAVMIHILGSDM